MPEALIGLGANLGDARATIGSAITLFCDGADVRLLARSSLYQTPPWGDTEQPPFINACIAVETSLSPHALLDRALQTEQRLGRDRSTQRRWGPRLIDIDLLAVDAVEVEEPGLILPHPRLLDRAFVLIPLAEIRPDWVIRGARIAAAVRAVDDAGIVRLPLFPDSANQG